MSEIEPPATSETGGWETVVGLEVHVELQTATKLFCGCRNAFGDEPNTNVCPVCLGLPGSLPVLNRQAVELAMRVGRALHCEVRPSIFHRKNYFYPDMPKDYQISQYDEPINVAGWLQLPGGHRVGIERAHLEEDTGKTVHMGGAAGRIHGAEHSLVDYNRAGVPLVEIVSRPDIRDADQARQYVAELRAILVATGASDAKMEEGSLRVDANISVNRPGAEWGTRCEIKNLNSIRSLGRAIEYEARRQAGLIEAGDTVTQETRHWNEDEGRTQPMRSKEEAFDYRYFPEPDLVPVDPGAEWIDAVDRALPRLPAERRARVAAAAGVEPAAAGLVVERDLDDLVISAIEAGADPARVLTHAEQNLAGPEVPFDGAALARLVAMETAGELTATQAKTVLAQMTADGGEPAEIAAAHGFEAMDTSELEQVVAQVLDANPAEWQRYCEGEDQLVGFFVGQVMKITKGQADGKAVTGVLRSRRG